MTPGGIDCQCSVLLTGDTHLLPRSDLVGDIGFERRVPALMRHHLDVVNPDRRRWVADSKCTMMRRPCQLLGTQTLL
jgi:hypothetical protein